MEPREKMNGDLSIEHITIGQKIVLHLMRFTTVVNQNMSAPYDLTQDGIGAVVGKRRAHVSIELKKLLDHHKAYCWKSHILGSCTKRNVYLLTEEGMREAERITRFLKINGIEPETLLDMKRCDPCEMWNSMSEEDRDTVGKACVMRVAIPRNALPRTEVATLPVDSKGLINMPRAVALNYLTFAEPARNRAWHSWAAEYWSVNGNVTERIFHLIKADRLRDAGTCVSEHWDELAANGGHNIMRLLKKIPPEGTYAEDVCTLAATVAMNMGNFDEAVRATDRLSTIAPDTWTEARAEIMIAFGHGAQAEDLALKAFKARRSVRNAALVSIAFAENNDVTNADRYARIAFDTMENTGEGDDLDWIFAARARVAALYGNEELAANMADQSVKSAPMSRKRTMTRIRETLPGAPVAATE